MDTTITSGNIIDIHKTGMKALLSALGDEGTQAFLGQFKGRGDFTADRYNNAPTNAEARSGIFKLQRERQIS
jgi:hypothetical protein